MYARRHLISNTCSSRASAHGGDSCQSQRRQDSGAKGAAAALATAPRHHSRDGCWRGALKHCMSAVLIQFDVAAQIKAQIKK
jgi:hypothetical protein